MVGLHAAADVMPSPAQAEWQFKPFVGGTFGGSTTYLDLSQGASQPHKVVGVTTLLIGETVGVEADLGYVFRVFPGGLFQNLVRRAASRP